MAKTTTTKNKESGAKDLADKVAKAGQAEKIIKELCEHLRATREHNRAVWIDKTIDIGLLQAMSREEITQEATSIYDNYIGVLETGEEQELSTYARSMSERIIPRGVTTGEVLGLVLVLRDILSRSLNDKYQENEEYRGAVMDVYEPAANRIATVVASTFVEERERTLKEQQEAIRELSTPVFAVWEQLLVLPIVGAIDSIRAKQLNENLLNGIRRQRAKVAILDITAVPSVDSKIASHVLQAVEAARLLGCEVILTGVSETISQTMVQLGIDLSRISAMLDLQSGIEEGIRILGMEIVTAKTGAGTVTETSN